MHCFLCRKLANLNSSSVINTFKNRSLSLCYRSTFSTPVSLKKTQFLPYTWSQETRLLIVGDFHPFVIPWYAARQLHSSSLLRKEEKKPETLQELVETSERQETAVTVGQKVVQAGKDVSYFGILLVGFAVTGALLWYVLSELFLSSSPNKVYAAALKKLKRNEEVMEELGHPIKAYGEETSRGRRRHVSFQEYVVAGENYMRVKFYVAGQRRKGTVHVDVKQTSSRNFEYRFIFIELEGFPQRTIVIEDNR